VLRRSLLLFGLVACHASVSVAPHAAGLPSVAPPPRPPALVAPAPRRPSPPTEIVVLTGAPYTARALWRVSSTGKIEPVAFPWAALTNLDTLHVSPDGREVAYVEGGSQFGPLLIRSLESGAKTVVAPRIPGRELIVVAWSPDGRKVLYASRRAGSILGRCHWGGCPAGPSAHFVFDRDGGRSVKTDLPGALVAWLASGERIVVGDGIYDDYSVDLPNRRLLSTQWDDVAKTDEVIATDLATLEETPISPPAPYSTYLRPRACPSGRRIAWLQSVHRPLAEALVVDGKTIVAPDGDLVGFAWIGEDALVAHYRNRLAVVDANDGTVRGTKITGADDIDDLGR